MNTAQSHLLGDIIYAQVGIFHICVDYLHDPLHQLVVGSQHVEVFHFLLLAFLSLHLVAHYVPCGNEILQCALQDIKVEWLDNISIGTCLKSLQLVLVTRLRCEQHYRYHVSANVMFQFGTQGVAVHKRHHHVAQHNVRHILQYAGKSFLSIVVCRYLERVFQFLGEILLYFHVILYDGKPRFTAFG